MTRRRLWRLRRHLGRGKHVASGEEEARGGRGRGGGGGGRGKFQLRLKKADRRSFAVGRCGERGDRARAGGKSSSSPVKEFRKLGPTWAVGRAIEGGVSWLTRGGEEEEGRLTVHTIKQAVCSEAGRVQTVIRHHSVAAVLPQARHRKEGGRKKCSADFSC